MTTEVTVTETTIDVNITVGPAITVETTPAPVVEVTTTASPTITVEVVQGGGGGGGVLLGDVTGPALANVVEAVHETSGPTKLTIGTIADGEFVKRVGATLVSGVPVGGVTSVSGTGAISVTPGTTPIVSVAQDAAQGTTSTRKIGTTAAADTTTSAGTSGSSTEASAKDHTHKIGAHASTHATGGADAIGQIAKLDAGNAIGSYVSTLQTVSTATGTVSAGVDMVEVTYSAAACTVTLPTQANAPIGTVIQVSKANTGTFKITATPDSGSSINGGAANASVDIPNSTVVSSTSTQDVVAQFRRTGASTWRMA